MFFGHANLKKLSIYHMEPNMGDNIVEIMIWTLPYNAPPLISLYHGLDPDHSIITGFQCNSSDPNFTNHIYQKILGNYIAVKCFRKIVLVVR